MKNRTDSFPAAQRFEGSLSLSIESMVWGEGVGPIGRVLGGVANRMRPRRRVEVAMARCGGLWPPPPRRGLLPVISLLSGSCLGAAPRGWAG